MSREFFIDSRRISSAEPPYVIAEIGANFFSVAEARSLIDAAAEAGADAVKVQTFRAETLSAEGAMFTFEDGSRVSQREYWKAREISEGLHAELLLYARTLGLAFFSTPSHTDDVALLERIGVPAHKIGSDDLTNTPFIQAVARTGKPVILSTGMCTLDEVVEAVNAYYATGYDRLALLHCLVGYPAPAEDSNLRMIHTLQSMFGCQVGFSDHTGGSLAATLAVSVGAVIVERHLTLDRSRGGPDDLVASDPASFAEYVRDVKSVPVLLGTGIKRIMPGEVKWREAGRKSIVAARPINRGEEITLENVAIKRPSDGLHPRTLGQLIGARARRDIRPDERILFRDVDWA